MTDPSPQPPDSSVSANAGQASTSRRWLWAATAIAVAALLVWGGAQALQAKRIFDAYIYALPLFEIEHLRYRAVFDPDNPKRHPLNTLAHDRNLADHRSRLVTTPNSDTLYSLAMLDLSQGPVRLDTPDTQGRYYSAAFIDAYTNNFAIIGRRSTGTAAQSVLVVGPRWQGEAPAGEVKLIRAPTDTALLLIRILVDGPDDLAAVRVLQDGFKLTAQGDTSAVEAPPKPVEDDGASFVSVVDSALARNPPPAADADELDRIARVGLGRAPGEAPLSAWKRYLPYAHALLKRAIVKAAQPRGGWIYPPPGIGDFGAAYKLRAAVALTGLLALPAQEATYANAVLDDRGAPLDGSHRYRLHLPPGGVPVEAFWSLSIYEVQPDGRLFFADNPIHRYAIGDRTPGLHRNDDGSIDIEIAHEAPVENADNWLPAPAGPIRIAARAYQPRPEMLDGRFRYPAIQRLD